MTLHDNGPLLQMLGWPVKPEAVSPKWEWLEDPLLPDSATVREAVSATNVTILIEPGTGDRFHEQDVVQIDGSRELMSVVTAHQDHLVMKRACLGTLSHPVEAGATLRRVCNPALDKAGPRLPRRVRRENLLELFQCEPDFPQDAERDLAFRVINGDPDSAPAPVAERRLRGIIPAIRAEGLVVDCGAAPISFEVLELALEQAFERGSSPLTLLFPPAAIRNTEASTLPRKCSEPRCVKTDSPWADYALVTDFGLVDFVPCIFVPNRTALLVDRHRLRLVAMEGATETRFEATLEIRNAGDGGHVLLQNFGPEPVLFPAVVVEKEDADADDE